MRHQGPCPEVHGPTSCASERDHFEILKHTATGVGRKKFSEGEGGNGKKTRPKNSIIKPP